MNPIHEIGRYDIGPGSVVAIRRRRGWRLWLLEWLAGKLNLAYQPDVYDVFLNNGDKIQFTEAEKTEYDTAMEWHDITSQWYGAAKGLGLRT